MTIRSPSPARRFAWLMLLVGVLLARGLTPEGWMPVAGAAGGIEIALCNGMGPDDTMVLTPDGKLHHKAPANGQSGDHPCAFAGLGIADAAPPVPVIVAPPSPVDAAPALAKIIATPGRGLAAPPPPATGPPALA
ncbi:MAG: hypothetical protein E7773_14080 [Sphingomonas sp.]|uniref:hypothetical protein n=1 Tax=Sphingomonas sp. TaxID=28214 RepID=UPI0011FBF889|nr:hypothetical protein [Sphingomonas sp.]THD34787.1 MAG: hypothetical protein E7773_14080 [Sphingomonas sp.]